MKDITVKGILIDKQHGGYIIEDIAKYYGYKPLELSFVGYSANNSVYKLPTGELILDLTTPENNNYNSETNEYTVKFRKTSKPLNNIDTTYADTFNKEISEYFNRGEK